eukprot:2093817-Pyramimonas_sp.AAC.1
MMMRERCCMPAARRTPDLGPRLRRPRWAKGWGSGRSGLADQVQPHAQTTRRAALIKALCSVVPQRVSMQEPCP